MHVMRTVGAAAYVLCALAGLLQPALAQEACGPDKLGVSRTVAIDASRGPQFGAIYRDGTLLRDGEIVLTFDDGPLRPYTRAVLEALAAQCTRATFFMIGRMAVADPEMVKEVARRGHTVATHTWSHGNLQALDPQQVETEIELGLSAVQRALGRPVAPFFRFPYLRDTPASLKYLQERRLAAFAIDIDSRDFDTRDAAVVHARVVKDIVAKRKGIVLLHDIQASTAKALPALLADLKEHRFRVVHIRPKTGAETLADYDALLQQQSSQRKRVASPPPHPLAKRSLTWSAAALSRAKVEAEQPAAPADEDWTSKVWDQ
jgi:peptidoglycan/xylan/chitin deacetylase (PgdA/CDA1 family)